MAALRAHPLFHKILEVDPEVLLPYMLERRGTSQEAMLRAFEATLRAGHRDGSVRKATLRGRRARCSSSSSPSPCPATS